MQGLLHEQLLDGEGSQTLFCEIESIVNGRPLTKVSDDPQDVNALTPHHLLFLKSNECVPPGAFKKSDGFSRRGGGKCNIFLEKMDERIFTYSGDETEIANDSAKPNH